MWKMVWVDIAVEVKMEWRKWLCIQPHNHFYYKYSVMCVEVVALKTMLTDIF